MRRMLIGLSAVMMTALLFGFVSEASAQMRIGYIFMDEIRMRARPYQDAHDQLQRSAGARQQEAEQFQTEIHRLQEQLERQRGLLTEQRKAERENAIRDKVIEYETWASNVQQELGRKQMELLQPLDERVMQLVQRISQDQGYDIVIDGSIIAYMKNHEDHNLTSAVIDKLEAE